MKKISSFLTFIYIISHYSTALALPPPPGSNSTIYLYCIECDSESISNQIKSHYQSKISQIQLECPIGDLSCGDGSEVVLSDTWVYFTDTGVNKGVKYSGSLLQSGQITVFPNFNLQQSEKNYLTDMSNLRALVTTARDEMQAEFDLLSDVTAAEANAALLKGLEMTKEKAVGDCSVSLSTPLGYFNNTNSRRANAEAVILTNLNANASSIDASIGGFSISVNKQGVSASIAGVISETYGDNRQHFGNGGNIVYDVTRDSQGRWSYQVNLQRSNVGTGIFGDTSGGKIPLSFFFKNSNGSYEPAQGSTPIIEDPCMAKEFEDYLEDNGYVVTDENGQGDGAFGDGDNFNRCTSIIPYPVVNRIEIIVVHTRYVRRPDGTIYFQPVLHKVQFDYEDVTGVENLCGAGSHPGSS